MGKESKTEQPKDVRESSPRMAKADHQKFYDQIEQKIAESK